VHGEDQPGLWESGVVPNFLRPWALPPPAPWLILKVHHTGSERNQMAYDQAMLLITAAHLLVALLAYARGK